MVAARRVLPDELVEVLRQLLASSRTAVPLDLLRTALSATAAHHGMRPMIDLTDEERLDDAITLAAVTPTIVGALHRLGLGLDPLPPRAARCAPTSSSTPAW